MDIDARNLDALRGEDEDALKELKHFLFKETVRIENEKKALKEDREKLIRERTQFRKEIDLLNHKMVLEHKRLKDETLFSIRKWKFCRMVSNIWKKKRKPYGKKSTVLRRSRISGRAVWYGMKSRTM